MLLTLLRKLLLALLPAGSITTLLRRSCSPTEQPPYLFLATSTINSTISGALANRKDQLSKQQTGLRSKSVPLLSKLTRSLSARTLFAYTPALLLEDSAYSCRVWITLIKLSYAPLQVSPRGDTMHVCESLCGRLIHAAL